MPSYISFFMLLFLFLFSPRTNFVFASRPLLESNNPGHMSTNTIYTKGSEQDAFRGGAMTDCLPKGFRFNSAPSRYINNLPLDSTLCSTTEKAIPKP
ncbi:hypothetical protein ISN45_Aa05g023610 [Arabidopsis thaliana x Arabidopsis arenosa]|uniref:Uncharacterized protein n=2 Tax=Arabidopsis TaxID=3701 RepID=A0A8T1ZYE6_ARASU|nr:hypothetical protein ISN45_Aa05g023610 [Arabidopsis thaliana x Arabidopsis arenosa]KAG7565713.1 hypothetical protein ISN44_As10g023590 [Arabidopsis suecica]